MQKALQQLGDSLAVKLSIINRELIVPGIMIFSLLLGFLYTEHQPLKVEWFWAFSITATCFMILFSKRKEKYVSLLLAIVSFGFFCYFFRETKDSNINPNRILLPFFLKITSATLLLVTVGSVCSFFWLEKTKRAVNRFANWFSRVIYQKLF